MVFKKGKSFKESFLILRFVSAKAKDFRCGIVVSKKVSKKAFVRNKIKRRIRAIVRPMIPKIKKKTDTVLFALPGLEKKDFWETEKIIDKLFKKAKLISPEGGI